MPPSPHTNKFSLDINNRDSHSMNNNNNNNNNEDIDSATGQPRPSTSVAGTLSRNRTRRFSYTDSFVNGKKGVFKILGFLGSLRPRPIEQYLLWVSFYFVFKIINGYQILNEWTTNIVVMEFLQDIGYHFGFIAMLAYLVGLIYATPRLYITTTGRINGRKSWHPSPLIINLSSIILIIGPLILLSTTLTIFSLNSTSEKALLIEIYHIGWSLSCFVLFCGFMGFGSRMVKVLRNHLEELQVELDGLKGRKVSIPPLPLPPARSLIQSRRLQSLETHIRRLEFGIMRLNGMKWVNSFILFLYAGITMGYGILRVKIIVHESMWVQYCLVIMAYFGPTVLVMASCFFIIIGSVPIRIQNAQFDQTSETDKTSSQIHNINNNNNNPHYQNQQTQQRNLSTASQSQNNYSQTNSFSTPNPKLSKPRRISQPQFIFQHQHYYKDPNNISSTSSMYSTAPGQTIGYHNNIHSHMYSPNSTPQHPNLQYNGGQELSLPLQQQQQSQIQFQPAVAFSNPRSQNNGNSGNGGNLPTSFTLRMLNSATNITRPRGLSNLSGSRGRQGTGSGTGGSGNGSGDSPLEVDEIPLTPKGRRGGEGVEVEEGEGDDGYFDGWEEEEEGEVKERRWVNVGEVGQLQKE
ncbi:hypothetical protein HDU76_007408 [Blyttiomyces sp. JEL0837]|nr:hypothetical protein HDU76_007408 [Blyttiomyces sp. JEL0837]